MPSASSSDVKLEIGHVLFIDIVGYSKLLNEEQKERLSQLTEIALTTTTVRGATDEQLVRLPAGEGPGPARGRGGEGAARALRRGAGQPARCALGIPEPLQKHPEIPVRMGIHSGPVSKVTD